MVNFKVSFDGKFKRFSTDLSKASFEYFCEKCRKVFSIKSESTLLLIFQERDRQLIIRNEIDFSITVLSNLHGSENRTFQFLIQVPEPSASQVDSLLINNHDLGNLLKHGMNHPDSQQFLSSLPFPLPSLRLEEDALRFILIQIAKKAKLLKRDQESNHQNSSIGDNQFINSQYDCSLITPESQIESSSVKGQELDSLITKFHLNIQNSFETSQINLQRSFESAFDQLNQSFRHMTAVVKPSAIEPSQIEQSMTSCSAYASLQKLNQYILNMDNQKESINPETKQILTNPLLNSQVNTLLLPQILGQQDNNDQSQFSDFNQIGLLDTSEQDLKYKHQ